MEPALLSQFWESLSGVFTLNGDTFAGVMALPNGSLFALLVVLMAGLSLEVGQAVILFINQVQPIRFVFSLLINAVLFTFGFLFLVLSTWLFTLLPWTTNVAFIPLLRVLGISYAPLLFGFLGALPYLGSPLLTVLSIWHLLAMVVGFGAIAQTSLSTSVWYVLIGWVVLQILQRVIGQPIANLGRFIANKVAGVELVRNRQELLELVRSRMSLSASPLIQTAEERIMPDAQQFLRNTRQRVGDAIQGLERQGEAIATDFSLRTISPNADATVIFRNEEQRWRWVGVALALVGMVVLAYLVVVLLDPVRGALLAQYAGMPKLLRYLFDLLWIGVVAIAFAGLLAPLETLGWWAGWYNDEVDTTINVGKLATPKVDPSTVSRYIIYLDGISQSTDKYLPDVEAFLDRLVPELPQDMALIRGLVGYSVLNNPLDEDRPLAFLWQLADKLRLNRPSSLLGKLINLRNILIVGVSSDKRYGPIYNRGIAQVMHNALVRNGYQPGSSVPVTLIGFSGGGQMACASAPFLRRAIGAPIDVISLGGVISANNDFLKLEHLYHLSGGEDSVERLGAIMFPGRWKLFPLSFWNRAKRLGKISFIPLGETVGHQLPGGIMDPDACLEDGRTHLQQTLDLVEKIVKGKLLKESDRLPKKESNYDLFKKLPFNQPDYYPLNQTIDRQWYCPIAPWMGRLILPQKEERSHLNGIWMEVHHAPEGYESLIGTRVILRWVDDPFVQRLVAAVTRDVHFSAEAEYTSTYGGLVHPTRLDHWQQVGPLESLAGSHPVDDVIVKLEGEVEVEAGDPAVLRIYSTPVQITGRYYGLVQFIAPEETEAYRVRHFNRETRQFDGWEETVQLPAVQPAPEGGYAPSTTANIEHSPPNEQGWYIYGAKDAEGRFTVQALAPRSLFQLNPDQILVGCKAGYRYIRQEAWANLAEKKGTVQSAYIKPGDTSEGQTPPELDADWQEGDRALVLHTYGGIGGNHQEPAAKSPIFFGHFAYGSAMVVREPLADELQFDIQYYQVYTHNTDGLIAGTLHWSRYMGDRQFGWAGSRPVCDILVKLDAFTEDYNTTNIVSSPLLLMMGQLQAMTARYRIGDGTGGTYVGPANNCSQDSNQALFNSLRRIQNRIETVDNEKLQQWDADRSNKAERYRQLVNLRNALEGELQTFGRLRTDWENNEYNLGSTIEDAPLRNLLVGIGSWRTLLPRKASDTIVRVFLQYDAAAWVLCTNQLGGEDPDIEAIAPMTL